LLYCFPGADQEHPHGDDRGGHGDHGADHDGERWHGDRRAVHGHGYRARSEPVQEQRDRDDNGEGLAHFSHPPQDTARAHHVGK